MRALFSLLLQLTGLLVFGQGEAHIDSLENLLQTYAPGDTARDIILVNLWRATSSSDLPLAAAYGRQMIAEGRRYDNLRLEAQGYQRLGIVQDLLGQKDSSFHNYRAALTIYNREANRELQGVMLYNIGILHEEGGRPDSALHYYERAEERFSDLGKPGRTGAIYLAMGSLQRQQGNLDEALRLNLVGREYLEEAGDPSWIAETDLEIANAYRDLGELEQSIRYLLMATERYAQADDRYYLAATNVTLGEVLAEMEQPDSARQVLFQARQTAREGRFKSVELDALSSLARVEGEYGSADRALQYYAEAVPLFSGVEQKVLEAELYADYAQQLAKSGPWDRATEVGRRALELARDSRTPANEVKALQALGRTHAKQGDFQRAYAYNQSYTELRDSVYRLQVAARMAELQTRYESERRERQLEEQASRLELLDRERRIARLQNVALLAGILSLLAAVGALFFSNRQRRMRNRAQHVAMQERLAGHQRELSTQALHLAQKNQFLHDLQQQLSEGQALRASGKLGTVMHSLQYDKLVEQDWNNFTNYFREVHGEYESRLREAATAKLSVRELRLAALIKMGLSNNEIAGMLNVSQATLYKAKYRLRKKLPAGDEEGLDEYLIQL